jgi:hypothetical protein
MGKLECSSAIREMTGSRALLEIVCRGVHEWEHGNQIADYIRERIDAERPVAIVLNLLEYDYEFGNDMVGLFFAWVHGAGEQIRPVCIAAQGRTRESLEALFRASGELPFEIVFASSPQAAVAGLREFFVPSERPAPNAFPRERGSSTEGVHERSGLRPANGRNREEHAPPVLTILHPADEA